MGRRRSTDDDGTVEKKAKTKFTSLDFENRTQLAKLVQKCEILWNFRHKDYKDVIQKQYAWETIAHKLDLPGSFALLHAKLVVNLNGNSHYV
jgi:hypothetical protein